MEKRKDNSRQVEPVVCMVLCGQEILVFRYTMNWKNTKEMHSLTHSPPSNCKFCVDLKSLTNSGVFTFGDNAGCAANVLQAGPSCQVGQFYVHSVGRRKLSKGNRQ